MDVIVIIWAALGYLAGSIPFGFILAKWAGLGDVRSIGSGNIGATNVLRTGSKKIAALTLLADALKGAIPVLMAFSLGSEFSAIGAGLGALLGHLFPVWISFRGGKGVATFLGITLALSWIVGAVFIVKWLIIAAIFRYSSLAAICAVIAAAVTAIIISPPPVAAAIGIMGAIVILRHHENIARLIRGQESRISFRKS